MYRRVTDAESQGVTDGRGRNMPANKIDDTGVIEHIMSFPGHQSHYSRKDNENKIFLNPGINIRK